MPYIKIKTPDAPEQEFFIDSLERNLFISEGFGPFKSYQEKMEQFQNEIEAQLEEEKMEQFQNEIEAQLEERDSYSFMEVSDESICDYFEGRSLWSIFTDRFKRPDGMAFISNFSNQLINKATCKAHLSELRELLLGVIRRIDDVCN